MRPRYNPKITWQSDYKKRKIFERAQRLFPCRDCITLAICKARYVKSAKRYKYVVRALIDSAVSGCSLFDKWFYTYMFRVRQKKINSIIKQVYLPRKKK